MIGKQVTYKNHVGASRKGLYLGLGSVWEELSNGVGQFTTVVVVDCETGAVEEVSEFLKISFDDPMGSF